MLVNHLQYSEIIMHVLASNYSVIIVSIYCVQLFRKNIFFFFMNFLKFCNVKYMYTVPN